MHRLKDMLREPHGSAMIEMAVVLPVFFMIIFYIFTFSIALFGYCNATYACRVAARYASMHSSTSLAPADLTQLQNIATPYLYGAPVEANFPAAAWSAGNTIGSTVTVTVKIMYPTGIPFTTISQIEVGSSAQRVITR